MASSPTDCAPSLFLPSRPRMWPGAAGCNALLPCVARATPFTPPSLSADRFPSFPRQIHRARGLRLGHGRSRPAAGHQDPSGPHRRRAAKRAGRQLSGLSLRMTHCAPPNAVRDRQAGQDVCVGRLASHPRGSPNLWEPHRPLVEQTENDEAARPRMSPAHAVNPTNPLSIGRLRGDGYIDAFFNTAKPEPVRPLLAPSEDTSLGD